MYRRPEGYDEATNSHVVNMTHNRITLQHPELGFMFTIEAIATDPITYDIEIIDHFNDEVVYANTVEAT